MLKKHCVRTIVGINGGLTFRSNKSSHEICLKNACFLTSSASRSDDPKRRSGFLRSNYNTINNAIEIFISINFDDLPFS